MATRRRANDAGAPLYLVAALWASAATAVLALVTVIVDVFDGDLDEPLFIVVALAAAAAAFFSSRNGVVPEQARGVVVVSAIVVSWLIMVAWSVVAYLLTGSISRIDDALFESVAGYSTTHLSVLGDLEATSRPVLFWRAGTQWVGGLSALLMGSILLPFWVGGREMADPGGRRTGFRSLAPTPAVGVRNIMKLYGAFTAVSWLLLGVSGAGVFDGLTYAMTTVSTGGFSNHPDSLRYFDSAALEWVSGLLMLIAGTSAAFIWWLFRGSVKPLLRSLELRVYVAAVVVATVIFTLADAHDGSGWLVAVRHGFVTATAVLSTTGHWVTNWASWSAGAQFLLLLLVSVGSMSGSLGGGYRWLQVIETVKFVRRELMRQLHPTANMSIRVGERIATEQSLDQMNAQRSLLIVAVGVGSVALSVFGLGIDVSMAAAVSAVSTFGPGLSDLAASSNALQFEAPARFILAVLMFAGRLSVYPIFLALGTVSITLRRQMQGSEFAEARRERDRRRAR